MTSESYDLLVAGAGPAGLFAAIRAARAGRRVLLAEKNERAGVKILVSGGNRCNLTHDCEDEAIVGAFGGKGAFLRPALRLLGPRALRETIESLGVPTKVEPGGKVFPVSNRAVDVRDAIEREMGRAGVLFRGGEPLRRVVRRDGGFLVETSRGTFAARRVVLATGGKSYAKTGTAGDGYPVLESLGHRVVPPTPALAPLAVSVGWVNELSGLTLPDVEISLMVRGRTLESRRGGFLFAHFGLSGPAPMNLSGAVATLSSTAGVALVVNFLPSVERGSFAGWVRAWAASEGARSVRRLLAERLPERLVDSLLRNAAVPADRQAARLAREERERLQGALFATRLPVAGTLGFDRAEVTRGGVALDEVDPRTLESRIVPGLSIAGEVLDLDGPIGGYNFTAAFATGALAGEAAGS
ncbi:MAG TPA: aminoacetone oxidase family FAD-binding enzyme [Planctomycetota bacterium]|nr:aminoacetone oxidase family FAD-binding enzyme [Planctomycetota bacterium]